MTKTKFTAEVLTQDDYAAIVGLYKTYTGSKEFLYIPIFETIKAALKDKNVTYIGVKDGNELVCVAKLALAQNDPFFKKPIFEKEGDIYSFSGWMTKKEYAGKKIGPLVLDKAIELAEQKGGMGIYADVDYKNQKSMDVISKKLYWLGIGDGRNGDFYDTSMHMIFYKSFNYQPENKGRSIIIDSSQTIDEVENDFLNVMAKEGYMIDVVNRTSSKYNLLHYFRSLPYSRLNCNVSDKRLFMLKKLIDYDETISNEEKKRLKEKLETIWDDKEVVMRQVCGGQQGSDAKPSDTCISDRERAFLKKVLGIGDDQQITMQQVYGRKRLSKDKCKCSDKSVISTDDDLLNWVTDIDNKKQAILQNLKATNRGKSYER